MKITPLDIRKQSFERVFRGYDKDAVDGFLTTLSQEWERLLDENRLLHERIERTEGEFSKLKALENTLYKTLQTAQATSQEMASKAQEESLRKVGEAQQQADDAVVNARKEASMLLTDAESKARYIIEEAVSELKGLERDIKAIEKYRETLIAQIKGYATDTLDKVQRFEEKSRQVVFEEKEKELREVLDTIPATETPAETPAAPAAEAVPADTQPAAETEQPSEEGSFFDKL